MALKKGTTDVEILYRIKHSVVRGSLLWFGVDEGKTLEDALMWDLTNNNSTPYLSLNWTDDLDPSLSEVKEAKKGTAVFFGRYKVEFKTEWNNVIVSTQYINYGKNASFPSVSYGTGYVSDGYTGTYTNITSDRTIVIKRKEYVIPIEVKVNILTVLTSKLGFVMINNVSNQLKAAAANGERIFLTFIHKSQRKTKVTLANHLKPKYSPNHQRMYKDITSNVLGLGSGTSLTIPYNDEIRTHALSVQQYYKSPDGYGGSRIEYGRYSRQRQYHSQPYPYTLFDFLIYSGDNDVTNLENKTFYYGEDALYDHYEMKFRMSITRPVLNSKSKASINLRNNPTNANIIEII